MQSLVDGLLLLAKADSGDLVEACQTRIARWEDVIALEKIVAEGAPQPRPKTRRSRSSSARKKSEKPPIGLTSGRSAPRS